MRQPRSLQALQSLGLEFWLPLPLLGLVFWVGGGLLTDQLLSHSYDTAVQLEASKHWEGKPSNVVLLIKVQIKENLGFSKVKVRTANSALKQLEFEFPVTEVSQIEATIGQELGLSPEQVRKLVRYQIDYRE